MDVALSYAAASAGKNKAATKAKEAAYTEREKTETDIHNHSFARKFDSGNVSKIINSIDESSDESNLSSNWDRENNGKSKGVRFKAEVDKTDQTGTIEVDKEHEIAAEANLQNLDEEIKQISDSKNQKRQPI